MYSSGGTTVYNSFDMGRGRFRWGYHAGICAWPRAITSRQHSGEMPLHERIGDEALSVVLPRSFEHFARGAGPLIDFEQPPLVLPVLDPVEIEQPSKSTTLCRLFADQLHG